MKFKPQTKEELNNLLPDCEAEFKIAEVKEGISANKNPQFIILVQIATPNGKIATLKDYITSGWKLRHFCYSAGLANEYESGEVTPKDIIRGEGKCFIKTEKGKMGDRGIFPDRNVISNYVELSEEDALKVVPPKKEKSEADPFFNDDIPNF